ncbi:MAG: (2Fe-2S)-binding protein [Acidobacteria bacterium]|nr:MAG: (2Fe-2S)-binding protein [Acidobacteriota bacterium]
MTTKPLHLDMHEQIECAQTLASRFYTDPAILAVEKTRIFQRTWQLAGTLHQPCGEVNGIKRTISDPESFFTVDVVGEPVIVVRDKQSELRAFSNVCRHRAGPIALGSGCKNVLRCQYHGWTYTLNGRLIGTPDVDGVEFFDRSTMGMVPLRCETWGQFIFVNFDLHAEPLSAWLGKIPEQARGFQFEGLEFAERRDYLIDCNWKVYVDNYLEGYHIPIAHPGLMKEIDYAQYRTDTYRYYSQQFAPIRAMKPEDSGERIYAPGPGLQDALYFWIFPNLMLNIYPDNIQTNVIVPLSHEKTLTIFEWFFHHAGSQQVREGIAKAIAFSEEVQREDVGLCEHVQRGLRSAAYDRGRYSVKRENGVHHFHMLLDEFLARP